MKLLKRMVVAVALAGLLVVSSAAAASAAPRPSNIDGGRISWDGVLPCRDGPGGTSVSTAPDYNAPGAGTYRTRIGLYRSNDSGRIALSNLRDTRVFGSGWLPFAGWSYRSSYAGETYVVGYVYKLGSDNVFRLVAREWIDCVR